MKELGLDRHPELRDDYFRHYTRVIWLAQRPTLGTKLAAERAAAALGLPLEVREVSDAGLEAGLRELLSSSEPVAPDRVRRASRGSGAIRPRRE
jgi:hypothetical protein